MERFADSYALASEAQSLIAREQLRPQLQHTVGARILCVSSQLQVFLRGDPAAAFIGPPKVQGPLRGLFEWFMGRLGEPVLNGEDPEFIVMIDAAIWSSLDATKRERLIFHELKHLEIALNGDGEPRLHEDGRFQLRVKRHDHEVFEDEIIIFGPEVCEIDGLCQAIVEGQKRARAKGQRRA